MLAILVVMSMILAPVQSGTRAAERYANRPRCTFVGRVERVGEPPGTVSGISHEYQQVRYRVLSVCSGELSRKSVIVDHLILTGDELRGVRRGKIVKVTAVLETTEEIATADGTSTGRLIGLSVLRSKGSEVVECN